MKKIILLSFMFSISIHADQIGKVTTSGVFFKDTITIDSFRDPTLSGIACHVTSPSRTLSFENQSNTSIACRQVADKVTGDYKATAANIFAKSKGLFFKHMRVDRFYDSKNNTLVYIAYTKKVSGDNASHSISTVPLYSAQ